MSPFKLSASSINHTPFSHRILACSRETRWDGTWTSLLVRRPTVRIGLFNSRSPMTLPSSSTTIRAFTAADAGCGGTLFPRAGCTCCLPLPSWFLPAYGGGIGLLSGTTGEGQFWATAGEGGTGDQGEGCTGIGAWICGGR